MNYSNENVRRQDRLLDESMALELLKNAEYGVLSMLSDQGGGYGVPLNYVWDSEKAIYFHCATLGRKISMIEQCEKVSFCIVGRTKVISDKFTTAYESIVLECNAKMQLSYEERMKALELILKKYSTEDMEKGMKYALHSFSRTQIVKLEIVSSSGKTKNLF